MILFVYLLFFGAKGIPSLAQTLGKAMYQFRNATKDVQDEILKGATEVKKQTSALRLDQIDIEEAPKPRTETSIQKDNSTEQEANRS